MAEGLQLCELDPDENPAELGELAVRMLRVWWDQVYPQLEAAAVELRMTGAIGGVAVQGTADVITAGGMLIDLKTASKKPAGISSSHALQLTTYAMLADQAAAKVDPPKRHTAARLYTITKTKTPAVVQQTVEITAEDRAYAEYIYPAVQEAARRGEVIPRRSSNLCSRKHCAYWRECQADYGGEVRQ